MQSVNNPVPVSVKQKSRVNTHKMIQIAMLGAIASVLMLFEFPLPFLAPSFYELDFSELPVLIGGFALGPVAGVIIELLKILLHLLIKGTHTAFVGELGNFLIGCLWCITIVGIPFGKQFFKIAKLALRPFGAYVVRI